MSLLRETIGDFSIGSNTFPNQHILDSLNYISWKPNSFHVAGIENWIKNLQPIGGSANSEGDIFIQMKDSETGAIFEIRRIG
jgi:hypothetical protein